MNRRSFTKAMAAGAGTLGAAALLPSPQIMGEAHATAAQPSPPQQADAPTGPRLRLSKEQEERVAFNVARNERQVAPLRARTLPYEAEPAFAFRVRAVKREPRRIRMGS